MTTKYTGATVRATEATVGDRNLVGARERKHPVDETNWGPTHNTILLWTYRGKTLPEIAKYLKYSVETVAHVRRSPYFQDKLQAMRNATFEGIAKREVALSTAALSRQALEKAQLTAARKIIKIMRKGTPDQKLQFEAAKDILDRTGLKPVEKIEMHERVYTPEEVERAKHTLSEVETIIARMETRDSKFLLAKQTLEIS